eukprot:SAG11_NODE_2688_length_3095_cov_2.431575_4_plen_78_part_00
MAYKDSAISGWPTTKIRIPYLGTGFNTTCAPFQKKPVPKFTTCAPFQLMQCDPVRFVTVESFGSYDSANWHTMRRYA